MESPTPTTARHRFWRVPLALTTVVALVAFMSFTVIRTAPVAHAAGGNVLLLGDTLCCGTSSPEYQAVVSLGLTPTVVNGATWDSMTAAQFQSYNAVVIGDPDCVYSQSYLSAAITNENVWEPAVNGPVVVIGSDPTFHSLGGITGATNLIKDGISFAASGSGTTGAYIALGCSQDNFGSPPGPQAVPLLNGFAPGGFTISSEGDPAVGPCGSPIHIVSSSPALLGLSDADLSFWNCSVHEGFDTWPGGWNVLAIDTAGAPVFTPPDGTAPGIPYIMARGTTFNCSTSDTDAPTISFTRVTDVNGKPAAQISVTDTNPSSGAAAGFSNIQAYGTNLQVIDSTGAVLGVLSAPTTFATVPGFLPTNATTYTFVAEKINTSSSAEITVQATDQCGNVSTGDPILHGKGLHGHRNANKSVTVDIDKGN